MQPAAHLAGCIHLALGYFHAISWLVAYFQGGMQKIYEFIFLPFTLYYNLNKNGMCNIGFKESQNCAKLFSHNWAHTTTPQRQRPNR
jgi:hypothetical protein